MTDKPSILVTGGAGYIGAHCCKALKEAGYNPICFDNLSTGHESFVQWGPFVSGDIRNTEALASALRLHNVVAVMHFAAFSAVGELIINPAKYFENNVGGTLSLLKVMRDVGCSRLVFSSTGAVYGNVTSQPIREEAAGKPINPYGRSKWMIEQILGDYRGSSSFKPVILRYFNASGADESGVIGELREPETHLIPRALMTLQGHLNDFAVFGDDYDTPDGTAVRDYIHVSDLAAAHVLALKALLNGHAGGTYNLGTGTGYSVNQILNSISKCTGRALPVERNPRRHGDPATLVADPSAAQRGLQFSPSHSDLETIIRTAWAWHQKAHPLKAQRKSNGVSKTKPSSGI